MSKASTEKLEALHGELAKTLQTAISASDPTDKGFASLLNVARQFLKDNGIEAAAVPGSTIGGLAKKVSEYPFDPAESSH